VALTLLFVTSVNGYANRIAWVDLSGKHGYDPDGSVPEETLKNLGMI
jgi:hypothetical protein